MRFGIKENLEFDHENFILESGIFLKNFWTFVGHDGIFLTNKKFFGYPEDPEIPLKTLKVFLQ